MRVIAGTLGGRRLHAPRGLATRPTSDRVREALFMTLEPLTGLRIVDLYAGSGALGIEALSRGAERADFVESSRTAQAILERNLEELGISGRATIWPLELPQRLNRLEARLHQADIVLLDPPYGGEAARATLAALGEMPLLGGVRVVVEHHARDQVPDRCGVLRRVRERRYGETQVSTYRIGAAAERPDDQESPS